MRSSMALDLGLITAELMVPAPLQLDRPVPASRLPQGNVSMETVDPQPAPRQVAALTSPTIEVRRPAGAL